MSLISVNVLVRYLKQKLDTDERLQNIEVTGELSNFHRHSSGHFYFTLKDRYAAISCVMFASNARRITFEPKNGDKVVIKGSISLFETSGQLQIYVTSLKKAGLGDLYQQYEELKNRLFKEGYFSQDHKKELPFVFPEKIAVLVGDKSAALSDIKTCFNRRWPLVEVDYYPVLVQGQQAPGDIINCLKKVDKLAYEAIILARGGGSFEDLFCFNDEELIKTIYDLDTFIVTGIGHEQDFTLCDFVSDLRAPTPTAAVELITPNYEDVINDLYSYKAYLNDLIKKRINDEKTKLEHLKSNRYFKDPLLMIRKEKLQLDYYSEKLRSYKNNLKHYELEINSYKLRSMLAMKRLIESKKEKVYNQTALLKAYSVDNTLQRGFALAYKKDKLIRSINDVNKNDELTVRLFDGHVKAEVK